MQLRFTSVEFKLATELRLVTSHSFPSQ